MRTIQLIAKVICFLALPPAITCVQYSGEHHMNGILHTPTGFSNAPVLMHPMSSLVKPQDVSDVCGADDNAYWREIQQCPVPVHIPWLCRLLGNSATCLVCLRSNKEGPCHRLFIFPVFAVTRAISHNSDTRQDLPPALRHGLLCQVILAGELLVATTSTFFLFLYLIIKLDRQRHIRDRNIRRRLQQLILHIYINCGARFLADIAMSKYVKICEWIGRQDYMNIDEQRERPYEKLEEGLGERLEKRLVEAPCDCDPFAGIKRSHDVDDDQANFEFVFG